MRRTLGGVTLASLVALPLLSTSAASAQTDCDVLLLSDENISVELSEAINVAEEEIDADLVVLLVDELTGSSLQNEAQSICPTAFRGSEHVQDDVVLLAVSLGDRQTEIWYGDDHEAALDPSWESIVDEMNGFFQDGEIEDGLQLGVLLVGGEIYRSVDVVAEVDEGVAVNPVPIQEVDETPLIVSQPSSEESGSSWPLIAGGLVGLGALGGGLSWRKRDQMRVAVAARHNNVVQATRDAQAAWYDIEAEAAMSEGRYIGAAGDRVAEARAVAAGRSTELRATYEPISNADPTTMTTKALRATDRQVGLAERGAMQLAKSTKKLVGVVETLAEREEATRSKLVESRQQLDRANGLITQREAEGWNTDLAAAQVADLTLIADRILLNTPTLALDDVGSDVDRLNEMAAELSGALELLEEWLASTTSRRDYVVGERDLQRSRVPVLEEAIASWSNGHAKASWTHATGLPQKVNAALTTATDELAPVLAIAEFPRDIGALERLELSLERAEAALAEADAELDLGDELDVALRLAAETSISELEEANLELEQLIRYQTEHAADLGNDFRVHVTQVREQLVLAGQQRDLVPPNHIETVRGADLAEQAASNAYLLAQERVAEMNRKRLEAKRAIRQAQAEALHLHSYENNTIFRKLFGGTTDAYSPALQTLETLAQTNPDRARQRADRIRREAQTRHDELRKRREQDSSWSSGGGAFTGGSSGGSSSSSSSGGGSSWSSSGGSSSGGGKGW